MTVISIVIEAFFAFGNGYEIVIATSGAYIKKIGSAFPSLYPFAIHALVTAVAPIVVKLFVIVAHKICF